jgi:hypothetical protein
VGALVEYPTSFQHSRNQWVSWADEETTATHPPPLAWRSGLPQDAVWRTDVPVAVGTALRIHQLGPPPAQIPASGITALGSHLGSWRRIARRAKDAFLSLLALLRTRSSSLCAGLLRLCVRIAVAEHAG